MLWNDILNFLAENLGWILVILALVLLTFVSIRYIKILNLFASCRKLAKLYNGKIEKLHPLFLRIILNFKEPDIRIAFNDKELFVMFVRIKSKTSIRFTDINNIEKIRYRKSIVPYSHNKGLSSGSVVTFNQGSEVTAKSSKFNFEFNCNDSAIKLILFTENVSEIRVYDDVRKNDDIIGDGEVAYAYHVGGRDFLKKWIERNS